MDTMKIWQGDALRPPENAMRTLFDRRALVSALCCCLIATASLSAPPAVPASVQGTWVSGKSGCDAPLRVVIAADRLTLHNGADSESLGGIEMAGPSYFPPGYAGIMAVLITEFDGQQPATATFNVGERKGTAQIEFAPLMPGKATPALTQYNNRIGKLNLAKRFPLDKVMLKRCAGGVPAK